MNIKGGRLIEVEGEVLLAIASRKFYQIDIDDLADCSGISGILFYYADFCNINFSILKGANLNKLSFLHGNFGDAHLSQLDGFCRLRHLQLLDTKASALAIEEFKKRNPSVTIS